MALVWPVADLLVEDGSEVGIGLLSGHTCSVWAVSVVPAKPVPNFLTASADKTIKLWGANYEQIGTFKGIVLALFELSSDWSLFFRSRRRRTGTYCAFRQTFSVHLQRLDHSLVGFEQRGKPSHFPSQPRGVSIHVSLSFRGYCIYFFFEFFWVIGGGNIRDLRMKSNVFGRQSYTALNLAV